MLSQKTLTYIANKSSIKRKYCAIILNRNNIISYGYNRSKIHTINNDDYISNKYCIHAEVDAIRKCTHLKNCKMIIIKIINNEIQNAQPCNSCYKLLCKYNIQIINYK